jgi:hypothetical protein
MAARTFSDSDGNHWHVWEVTPGEHLDVSERRRNFLPSAMAGGWLCFAGSSGKRRLYPVPPRWPDHSETELEGLCRAAEPVSSSPTA